MMRLATHVAHILGAVLEGHPHGGVVVGRSPRALFVHLCPGRRWMVTGFGANGEGTGERRRGGIGALCPDAHTLPTVPNSKPAPGLNSGIQLQEKGSP